MKDYLQTSLPTKLPSLLTRSCFVPETARFFDPKDETILRTGHLPHWRQQGRTYFLTFVLGDALPKKVRKNIKQDRKSLQYSIQRTPQLKDRSLLKNLWEQLIEEALHQEEGACLLRNSKYRDLVGAALRYFDGKRYDLHAWGLMPNHVHVLVTLRRGQDLGKMLHSWKSFTAHKINALRGIRGKVWQHESFDHLVRNVEGFRKFKAYILANPKGSAPGSFEVGVEVK